MKIRGNTIGTPLRPSRGVVKATDLTPEEQARVRQNFGVEPYVIMAVGSLDRSEARITSDFDWDAIMDRVRAGLPVLLLLYESEAVLRYGGGYFMAAGWTEYDAESGEPASIDFSDASYPDFYFITIYSDGYVSISKEPLKCDVDPNLLRSGAAADAKIVGDKLSEMEPYILVGHTDGGILDSALDVERVQKAGDTGRLFFAFSSEADGDYLLPFTGKTLSDEAYIFSAHIGGNRLLTATVTHDGSYSYEFTEPVSSGDLGDVSAALDHIIALQESLIGGDSQ